MRWLPWPYCPSPGSRACPSRRPVDESKNSTRALVGDDPASMPVGPETTPAALIKAMISRSREFVADADGAKIAGSPNGLAHALRKLESYAGRIPLRNPNPAMNNMFIVEPLLGAKSLGNLFASHPPTEKRIAALMSG